LEERRICFFRLQPATECFFIPAQRRPEVFGYLSRKHFSPLALDGQRLIVFGAIAISCTTVLDNFDLVQKHKVDRSSQHKNGQVLQKALSFTTFGSGTLLDDWNITLLLQKLTLVL
jgi:hypothetical protein